MNTLIYKVIMIAELKELNLFKPHKIDCCNIVNCLKNIT